MALQALGEQFLRLTSEAGFPEPVIENKEEGALTIYWTEQCVLCRIEGPWIVVCGWGPVRGLRRAFRTEDLDEVVALISQRALGKVTVTV